MTFLNQFSVAGIALCFCGVATGIFGSPARSHGQPSATDVISLASPDWHFQIDRDDVGTSQSWWKRELGGKVKLPGSMTESRLGDDLSTATEWTGRIVDQSWFNDPFYAPYRQPGHIKLPFWLTPVKHYIGPAWYQREVVIPAGWEGKPEELFLERAHWRTDVWMDDKAVGHRDSLSAPHEYQIAPLTPGRHRITIRIDNRLQVNVGENAHSVTDHTQTNWNGIVGRIELRRMPEVSVADVKVYPDAKTRSVRVVAQLEDNGDGVAPGNVKFEISSEAAKAENGAPGNVDGVVSASVPFRLDERKTSVSATLHWPGDVKTWDEFHPNLYRAVVSVLEDRPDGSPGLTPSGDFEKTHAAHRDVTFGFRDFVTSGTEFTINGHRTILRGTLECCIFPLTGYPPTEKAPWLRIMRIARSYGLNHLRFHSWCPPEAAFEAADEMGFYLSIECDSWTNPGSDAKYDKWLYAESRRIVDTYGNHPSFCMMLYGNEPHGPKRDPFLTRFVNYWKKRDPRRLYSSGSAYPLLPENDYQVTPIPRIESHWGGMVNRIKYSPPETTTDYEDIITSFSQPVVSHEIGQWCVYPNLAERSKYTGVLKAYNFDIFADSLKQHHMLDQAHDFLMASGKLQAICYKEEIESALRTKGMGGFQLLDLHDFPGQGSALVGVLDPFWDSKGYISPEEYRSFTGPVVPLARLSKRVFTNDEHLTCSVEIANYGDGVLAHAAPTWTLTGSDSGSIASGKLRTLDIPVGNGIPLGRIDVPLAKIAKAEKLVLTVSIPGSDVHNSWDVWVYPAKVNNSVSPDILVAHELGKDAMARLKAGGKVLLIPNPDLVKNDPKRTIKPGFTTIFWNTAWFPKGWPTTLGILCDPKNPALAEFPTDFHSNWQWWYLVHNSPVMILDALKPGARPIVQMIDDWNANRRLGYIFETRYGGGKLLVCSLQVEKPEDGNPVARQLLHSLLVYMQSNWFKPSMMVSPEMMSRILQMGGN